MKPREISISTDTFIRALIVGVAAFLVFTVRDIIMIILVAVVIASATEPAISFFSRFKFPRALSTSIVYAGVLTFISFLFYFIAPIVVEQVSDFFTTLPEYSSEILPDALEQETGIIGSMTLDEVVSRVGASLNSFSGNIVGIFSGVFGGLFNFILIITIAFYLSIQKNGIARFIKMVSPSRHTEYVLSLWTRSQEKIGKWFQGMVTASILVGAMTYLGLLLLGIPYAIFFALLATILNFIPIIGPNLAAIPAVIVGFVDGGILLAVLVAAMFFIVQAIESYVIFPLVLGSAVGVSPLVIIIAIGVGSKLAGFLGILLAVPMAAILLEFISDMRERNTEKKREEAGEEPKAIEHEHHG